MKEITFCGMIGGITLMTYGIFKKIEKKYRYDKYSYLHHFYYGTIYGLSVGTGFCVGSLLLNKFLLSSTMKS